MKTRRSKYIFTLCTHSEVRTKLLRFRRIPISLHTHILTSHVLLCYVWKKAGTSVVWLSFSLKLIGHTYFHTSNEVFKLVEALLEIHSSFFSHSIITRAFPLSAVTAALHYLPRCLSSTLTCDETPTTVTSSEHLKICCHDILRNQEIQNNSLASFATCHCRQRTDMSELQAHRCMSPELGSCVVRFSATNKALLQKLNQLPYWFKYNAHSCITRALHFLIENWYKFFFWGIQI